MEAYRLSRRMYAQTLSGKGAAVKGARWNSLGTEMIYLASNRSLAMAEVAVHLTLSSLPGDFVMMSVFIPDSISLKKINEEDLPKDWNVFPHIEATQLIGDRFVRANKTCILQVPSVVTKGDSNLLINPRHHDFKRIKITEAMPFPFDERIFNVM